MHVSFVKFVREGLNIENIVPTPPPVMLLSDGGHVENLAILPLLKKKLKKIIVVDGGYYSNEMKYGEDLQRALMLARRDLNCSFIGQGGRDVISDMLENFVRLQKPDERKPRHFRYLELAQEIMSSHFFYWFRIANLFLVLRFILRFVSRVKLGPSSPCAIIYS